MKDQPKTYLAAYTELQQILLSMQQELEDPEELTKKVKRAKELLEFCRQKLRVAEQTLIND